jgi:pSer/pThr/pTyr-binding forkhead associated (FHA) protein
MTDNLENDVTVGAQTVADDDHPQAGIASEGWSSPQADLATPAATFGKLVLKRSGAETDVEFPVNPPTTIGRFDPGVGPIDIDLGSLTPEGSYVSRKHARIVCEDGKFVIKDLGSSNGTFVLRDDFERVEEAELTDGQEIAFGNARFVFHATAPETPLAADPQS